MSTIQAWQWIFANWGGKTWKQIPLEIQKVLNLDSRLGVCNFSLVSKTGAKGIETCVNWLNRERCIA